MSGELNQSGQAFSDAGCEAAAEPHCGGLSLSAYVAVGVALSEGFALHEVLRHHALSEVDWERGQEAWAQALAEEARGQSASLQDAYAAHWLSEVERYARRVEPLGSELGAWCGFFCAWLAAEDPPAFLAGYGLSPGDFGRLQSAWSRRFPADPALLKRYSTLLAAPPQPPAKLDAAAKVLPPPRSAECASV